MTKGGEGGDSFAERLRSARRRQGLEASPGTPGAAGPPPSGLGFALRIGVELVSAMAVAVLIGWGLDSLLGTRPFITAGFVLVGGAAGAANVWRVMAPDRDRPGQD